MIIFGSKRIKELEKELSKLRFEFDNPPKFKAGDEVMLSDERTKILDYIGVSDREFICYQDVKILKWGHEHKYHVMIGGKVVKVSESELKHIE